MLARKRPGDHPDYRRDWFERCLEERFTVVDSQVLSRGRGSSTMPDPPRETRAPGRSGTALTLALSALPSAQPIFDILGQSGVLRGSRVDGHRDRPVRARGRVLSYGARRARARRELEPAPRAGPPSPFVGGLVGLVALHVLAKTDSLSGPAALVGAAVIGAAGALLYARVPPVRAFVSVLAPAPVVFLLLLVGSSVSKLVFVESAEATTVAVQARAPSS